MKKSFFKIKKIFKKRIYLENKNHQTKIKLSYFSINSLSGYKNYNKAAYWTSELKAKRIKVKLT